MGYEYRVVKLHEFPELIEEAAHLLSSEWPRSLAFRCHSLRKSSDDLPCSLLLLQSSVNDDKLCKVVGYSRLSRVFQRNKLALIESVVVDKNLRGCGLGRMLMEGSEDYARIFGFETLHLSTHDKCTFYEHLGYHTSFPVTPEREVTRFLTNTRMKNLDGSIPQHTIPSSQKVAPSQKVVPSLPVQTISAPPLPPPPPPIKLPSLKSTSHLQEPFKNTPTEKYTKTIWMEKNLINA